MTVTGICSGTRASTGSCPPAGSRAVTVTRTSDSYWYWPDRYPVLVGACSRGVYRAAQAPTRMLSRSIVSTRVPEQLLYCVLTACQPLRATRVRAAEQGVRDGAET